MFLHALFIAATVAATALGAAATAVADPPYTNCKAAAADGRQQHPQGRSAYRPPLDRDGIACES
jgi:hypothetical protein